MSGERRFRSRSLYTACWLGENASPWQRNQRPDIGFLDDTRPGRCIEDIFKVYAPALFMWRVRCKIMPGDGRPLADSGDVLSDFGRQFGYMMTVPGIIPS